MPAQLQKEPQRIDAPCLFDGIKVGRIEIESAAEQVEVLPAVDGEIRAKLLDKRSRPIDDGRVLHVEPNGSTLRIWVEYPLSLFHWHAAGILRVHMPTYCNAQVHVASASGAVLLRGIRAQELRLTAASGMITAEDCRVRGVLYVEAKSGRICLEEVEAERVLLRTASGSIETKRLVASSLQTKTASGASKLGVHGATSVQCESMSGSIQLLGETHLLDMSSASGRLRADVSELEEASFSSASGSVELELHEPSACRSVRVQTASGSVRLTLPRSVCPQPCFVMLPGRMHFKAADFSSTGPVIALDIKTMSGSVSVRPA